MNRKISILLFAAIIMMLTVASDAFAQNYTIQNNSPVPVTIIIQGVCPGPPPSTWTVGPFVVPPGAILPIPIPPPPCFVTDVNVDGVWYAMGYNGPAIPPPPPSWITVNPMDAIIW